MTAIEEQASASHEYVGNKNLCLLQVGTHAPRTSNIEQSGLVLALRQEITSGTNEDVKDSR